MIEKARQDLETNISSSDKSVDSRSEAYKKLHESQGEPRGERDVIVYVIRPKIKGPDREITRSGVKSWGRR